MVKWSTCSPYNVPTSNPAEVSSFSVSFVIEKNENILKEAGVGPFLNTFVHLLLGRIIKGWHYFPSRFQLLYSLPNQSNRRSAVHWCFPDTTEWSLLYLTWPASQRSIPRGWWAGWRHHPTRWRISTSLHRPDTLADDPHRRTTGTWNLWANKLECLTTIGR